MWRAGPLLESCNALSPDGLHRCAGPRGHHGWHGSHRLPMPDYTWGPRGDVQQRLGNSGKGLLLEAGEKTA